MRNWMIGLSVATLVAAFGVVSPAAGQSAKKYKQQVAEYSKQLDTLAEKDEWGVSKEDRARARQWLEDARERLAKGDSDTAGWLVKQVGEAIDLIHAVIRVKELEAMADEQEETYHRLKEERAPKLKSEIEELRKQKQKLESELQSL